MQYILAVLSLFVVLSGCALRGGPISSNPPKSPSPATISQVNLYQVVPATLTTYTGDKITIACDESITPVLVSTKIMENDKFAGLREILRMYDPSPSGLSNPRKSQTNLTFYSYELQDKTLTINLTGTIRLDGECDTARLQETFVTTYKQLGVEQVNILINGKPLDSKANDKQS